MGGLAGVAEHALDTVVQVLAQAGDVGGDDGLAEAHREQQRAALVDVLVRKHDDVGHAQQRGELGVGREARAEADAGLRLAALDRRVELAGERGRGRARDHEVEILRLREQLEGVEQPIHALVGPDQTRSTAPRALPAGCRSCCGRRRRRRPGGARRSPRSCRAASAGASPAATPNSATRRSRVWELSTWMRSARRYQRVKKARCQPRGSWGTALCAVTTSRRRNGRSSEVERRLERRHAERLHVDGVAAVAPELEASRSDAAQLAQRACAAGRARLRRPGQHRQQPRAVARLEAGIVDRHDGEAHALRERAHQLHAVGVAAGEALDQQHARRASPSRASARAAGSGRAAAPRSSGR